MTILLPVTDNFFFLNQLMRDFFPCKNVPNARVYLVTTANEADTLPTGLSHPVAHLKSQWIFAYTGILLRYLSFDMAIYHKAVKN